MKFLVYIKPTLVPLLYSHSSDLYIKTYLCLNIKVVLRWADMILCKCMAPCDISVFCNNLGHLFEIMTCDHQQDVVWSFQSLVCLTDIFGHHHAECGDSWIILHNFIGSFVILVLIWFLLHNLKWDLGWCWICCRCVEIRDNGGT